MAFVFLFKGIVSQTIFSIALGSLNVVLVYILLKRVNQSTKTSLMVTLFFAFGTNHWYLSSVGSAWFFAHITALFFLLIALIETFGKGRLLVIGFLLGASFWARTTEVFTLPFFYIFFWKKFWPINKKNFYNFFSLNIGIIFFILLDAIYNFLRFGNFSVLAPYFLIPHIENDPMFKDGFMNINFIARHIDAVLFRLPKLINKFPFLIPSLYRTALWFTSPALFYIFKARKDLLYIACWAAIVTTLGIVFLWAGVGYAQFGYRFIQDVMPFLLLLMVKGIGQKLSKLAYFLILVSIIINAWGTILINKFDIFFI